MSKKTAATPLERFRRARTMSQADLARLARVSQQTISKAEKGLLPLSTDVKEVIATILGAPVHEVFPESEQAVAS